MKRSLLDLVREPFAFLCKSRRAPPWLRPHPQLPLGLTQSEPFLEQNHQKIHFSERSLPEHQNQRNWYHSDPLFKTEVPPTSRQHPISMLRVSLQSILSSNFRSLSVFFCLEAQSSRAGCINIHFYYHSKCTYDNLC